jgi:hypothetical protein
MQLSLSCKAASCAASKKFSNTSSDATANYRVLESQPPVPTPNLTNPVLTTLFHHSKIHFNIIITPTYVLVRLVISFLVDFPPITYMHSSSPPSCYMPCQSHCPEPDLSNYTQRRVQVMKLLIMVFSQTICPFLRFRSKYSPLQTVLAHTLSFFNPIQSHRLNYSFVHSNFSVSRQQIRRQNVLESIIRIQSPPNIFLNKILIS